MRRSCQGEDGGSGQQSPVAIASTSYGIPGISGPTAAVSYQNAAGSISGSHGEVNAGPSMLASSLGKRRSISSRRGSSQHRQQAPGAQENGVASGLPSEVSSANSSPGSSSRLHPANRFKKSHPSPGAAPQRTNSYSSLHNSSGVVSRQGSLHTSGSSSIGSTPSDAFSRATPLDAVAQERDTSAGSSRNGSAGASGSGEGSGQSNSGAQDSGQASTNGALWPPAGDTSGTAANSGTGSQLRSEKPSDPSVPQDTPTDTGVKLVPAYFDDADPEDIIILVADMLNRLVVHNDQLPLHPSSLTRFHSRAAPQISVLSYLRRISKYTSLEKVCCLILLIYIDRISVTPLGAHFTVCSLTVHRFVCSATACASKALCDAFSTNGHYAKVGGVSLIEMNMLEKEFLNLIGWNLSCTGALLQQYYTSLVRSHPAYALDTPEQAKERPDWARPVPTFAEPILATPDGSPSILPSPDQALPAKNGSAAGIDVVMDTSPNPAAADAQIESHQGLNGLAPDSREELPGGFPA